MIKHYKKGKHIFDKPRNKDSLFPTDKLIRHKIENSENIQHVIMREVALISSQLNISAKKASSIQMENFVRQILKVGIQLKSDFSHNSLNTKDVFQMPNVNILNDYIKLTAEATVKNLLLFFKEKFISLEMDSGTVNKLTAIHFVLTIPDSVVVKPFLYDLVKNINFDSLRYSNDAHRILNELLDQKIYICAIIVDNLRSQTNFFE